MATARKLPSGSWRVLVYAGHDAAGKRRYESFTASSKADAEYQAAEYLRSHHRAERGDLTVGEAMQRYIDTRRQVLSPSTVAEYEKTAKLRFLSLQPLRLRDITTERVQAAVNAEIATGLSAKTVCNSYGVLRAALSMCDVNLKKIVLPRKTITQHKLPEVADVIDAVMGTPAERPTLIALWLGLRLSELLGMQYQDISPDGVLTIRRVLLRIDRKAVVRETTKTEKSTRSIQLPPMLLDIIGTGAPEEFVVPLSGTAVYKRFQRAMRAAELPHMSFHDLRHMNASAMLMLGVPDKYAMERGGWASPAVMKSRYQQTFSSERQRVDTVIDDYFTAALAKSKK